VNSGLVIASAGSGHPNRIHLSDQSAFAAGALSGSLIMAVPLLAFGAVMRAVPEAVRMVVLVTGLLTLVAVQATGRVASLPQNRRQVPRQVVAEDGWLGPFQFGAELGSGLRTYISSVGPFVVLAAVLLGAPSPLQVVAVAVGYGAARGFFPVVFRRFGGSAVRWSDIDEVAGVASAVIAAALVIAAVVR